MWRIYVKPNYIGRVSPGWCGFRILSLETYIGSIRHRQAMGV